jgi:hypothetical protein
MEHDRDQWSFTVGYLDTLEDWTGARSRCWALQAAAPGARAPYLAECELLKRTLDRCGPDASLPATWQKPGYASGGAVREELGELAAAYVDRFSAKPCCHGDMKPYLIALRGGPLLATFEAKFFESIPTPEVGSRALLQPGQKRWP